MMIIIDEIRELLPTMVIYQFTNVNEITDIIDSMQLNLLNHPSDTEKSKKLVIIDKFSNKKIIIFRKELIMLGRENDNNDIIIKSKWVSSQHLTIDMKFNQLTDNDSTNGTFINGKNKIKQVNLNEIKYFNIADVLDISVQALEGCFVFKIMKIFDDEIKKDADYANDLSQSTFCWIKEKSRIILDNFNIVKKDVIEKQDIVVSLFDSFIITENLFSKTLGSNTNEEIYTDRYIFKLI
jgi:hypothetical protein